jgi:hypothetical protein
VLDILQKVFYRSNPAREAFVELCEDTYVQKMTFDSYLYKTVVPGNPVDDFKLLVRTVGGAAGAGGCWGCWARAAGPGASGWAAGVGLWMRRAVQAGRLDQWPSSAVPLRPTAHRCPAPAAPAARR